jgi:hypothetical protein
MSRQSSKRQGRTHTCPVCGKKIILNYTRSDKPNQPWYDHGDWHRKNRRDVPWPKDENGRKRK